MNLLFDSVKSPLGPVTVVCGEDLRLVSIHFGGPAEAPENLVSENWIPSPGALAPHVKRLKAYFSGDPLAHRGVVPAAGTPFQRKVWQALLEIPFGESRTYKEIAERVGSAPRAVGGAIGANPLAILVPCHRVIASDGTPGGFAWGLEKKALLRAHEGLVATP